MKNVLMKFAGLFVERVPVDERGNPVPPGADRAASSQPGAAAPAGAQPTHPQQPTAGHLGQPLHGAPSELTALTGIMPPGGMHAGAAGAPIAVALRAWVPQEYAAHLAPFGVHVIAAGGSVTSEQAQGWGAQVLVVSAECLGQDIHLLQQPQLPTVFITTQAVMIPDVAGVVQVQEPLRASDVSRAVRDAAAAYPTLP